MLTTCTITYFPKTVNCKQKHFYDNNNNDKKIKII